MLYDLKQIINRLTADQVNESWPLQYAIYANYIGKFKLGKAIKSPFRQDDHPSFCVYVPKSGGQSLLWHDFATEEKGNWCTFLKRITGENSIDKALSTYTTGRREIMPKIEEKRPLQAYKTNIGVTRRTFNKNDFAYWGSYGITPDILTQYHVAPISKYFVNDKVVILNKTERAYCFKVFNHFKIYRPDADRTDKWRTNTTQYDIMGFEQLPEGGDLLIITKALKDVMTLTSLGYVAIAPQCETNVIPENIMSLLQSRFKELVVFFDNDAGGLTGQKQYLNKYKSLKSIVLPKGTTKDISDYYQANGAEAAKKMMKEILTWEKTP